MNDGDALTQKRHPYNQWTPDARAMDVLGDKWTLLIIRDLATGPRRFVELRSVLPGISTQQLRARLMQMAMTGLLTRKRFREAPPRTEFSLTERGLAASTIIRAYSDWGRTWVWGTPRETELVAMGAIFRAAVGRPLRLTSHQHVLVTVEQDGGELQTMRVSSRRGRLSLEEQPDEAQPEATIRGSEDAWVEALRPSGRRQLLSIDGDERLAQLVLAALIGPETTRGTDVAAEAAAGADSSLACA